MTQAAVAFAIAVDWGTSSLRLWLLGPDGDVLAQTQSDRGADRLSGAEFAQTLQAQIAVLADQHSGMRRDVPVVMCGMVGARNGWLEAPYVPVPAVPTAIVRQAVKLPAEGRGVHILPGMVRAGAQNPDVMRGEETQILGLAATDPRHSGVLCLPGTHCKWIDMADGLVVDFHTAMTGELYTLLARHSVLRHVIDGAQTGTAILPAFVAGASEALARPDALIHALFSVRAAGLVSGQTREQAAARLSGLLIGADIGTALRDIAPDRPITLVATGPLAAFYRRVFSLAGRMVRVIDADAMARRGLFEAARLLHAAEMHS